MEWLPSCISLTLLHVQSTQKLKYIIKQFPLIFELNRLIDLNKRYLNIFNHFKILFIMNIYFKDAFIKENFGRFLKFPIILL
jgi:hypothetical protein